MHTLRSLHCSGWSVTSCLLTIRLGNSSYPHLQVVVVAPTKKSALLRLVPQKLFAGNPPWEQFLPSPAGGGGGCTH